METLKRSWDKLTSRRDSQVVRKLAVLTFCFVCMLTAFAHAFPVLPGFASWRATTTPSTRALGINQQWRMFTSKTLTAIPTKLSVVYKNGNSKLIVVRREQVSMSRRAENRFAESTFWSTGSQVIGAYLSASCKRYAEEGNPVVSITMLQARIQIPQTPDETVVPSSPSYQPVRYVTCQSN